MANKFSIEAVFRGRDQLSAPFRRMQKNIGKFASGAKTGFASVSGSVAGAQRSVSRFVRVSRRELTRLSNKASSFGRSFNAALGIGGAAAGVLALKNAIVGAATAGLDLGEAIARAAAKFPGRIQMGSDAYASLEAAARETGATTEFTAVQSAQALDFAAMAGYNAQQAILSLPGVVDLATAANVDLARASDISTDALGAFSMASEDAAKNAINQARVNDLIVSTATSANTSIEQMFETITEGGPVAVAAGQSIETFATLTGVMASSGIKASRAGTTLKNFFIRLVAPAGEASRALRRLRISVDDGSGNMRSAIDILADLREKLSGLGNIARGRIIDAIFGKIPLAGVNVLLSATNAKLVEFHDNLLKTSGSTRDVAESVRKSLNLRLKMLTSSMIDVGITIFKQLEPSISVLVERATNAARSIGSFLQTNRDAIPIIMEMGGNLLKVASVFGVVKIATVALSLAMSATPFGLIVLGLTTLIALMPIISRNWDTVIGVFTTASDFWVSVFNPAVSTTSRAVSRVGGVFIALANNIIPMFMPIVNFWKFVLTPAIEAVFGPLDSIKSSFEFVANAIISAFNPIADFFSLILPASFSSVGEKISTIMGDVVDRIKLSFEFVSNFVYEKFNPVIDFFSNTFSPALSFVGDSITTMMNPAIVVIEIVAEKFEGLLALINSVISAINPISSIIDAAFKPLRAVSLSGVFNSAMSFIGGRDEPQRDENVETSHGSMGIGTVPIISPQERIARTIEERTTNTNATLTIDGATDRASLSGNTGPGISIQLAPSGGL